MHMSPAQPHAQSVRECVCARLLVQGHQAGGSDHERAGDLGGGVPGEQCSADQAGGSGSAGGGVQAGALQHAGQPLPVVLLTL